jgi:hypothetical protein
MLTNVFENRNRYFSNLIKLGDLLGRSLRENVELFSIEGNEATFITENNKVLKGTFDPSKPHLFQNIKIEDTSIFENKDNFSKLVDNKVSKFLSNIIENDLIDAENSFDDVLNLWELRLQFDVTKKKLVEKAARLNEARITSTPEFKRLLETKDILVSFLRKNSKVISQISEIKSAVKLASAISQCFDFPRVTYDSLNESTFKVPGRVTQNLYEHLTKTELINKELNESKENFNSIWSTRDEVVNLVSMIYEQDQSKVYEALAQTIHQIPYFAFATKKQLTETFRTILNVLEQDFSDIQLKKFSSLIYESKKPVKNYLTGLLNEKYGINVANLTEVPTFSTLANTESVIFEALSLITPKNSNLTRVLKEMSQVLKNKNGVETIDVADFLTEIFHDANYKTFINETNLLNYLDFNRVADDLGKIGTVLKMIQGNLGSSAPAAGGMGGDTMGQDIGGLTQALGGMGDQEEEEMPEDQYGAEIDAPEDEMMPEDEMEQTPAEGEDNDDVVSPDMDAEEAALSATEEDVPEEGMEEEMPEDDMGEEMAPEMEQQPSEDLLGNLKELEDMISQLKIDMGIGEDIEGEEGAEAFEGEETPEEEAMEHEGMENEEDEEGNGDIDIDVDTADADADSDSDDDEVHIDIDSHKDEEEEGEEEEDEEDEEDEDEEEEEKQEESSHKKLKGKQYRLDKNKNGKLDKQDFLMLRKKKHGKSGKK